MIRIGELERDEVGSVLGDGPELSGFRARGATYPLYGMDFLGSSYLLSPHTCSTGLLHRAASVTDLSVIEEEDALEDTDGIQTGIPLLNLLLRNHLVCNVKY